MNALRLSIMVPLLAVACASQSVADDADSQSGAATATSSAVVIAKLSGGAPLHTDKTHAWFVFHGSGGATDSLRRIPRDGGPEETMFSAPPGVDIVDFLLDGPDHAYAALVTSGQGGDLVRIDVAAGTSTVLAHAELTVMTSLALDATHLYVASRAQVLRVSKTTPAPAEIVADAQEDAFSVALDADRIYWTTWGKGNAAVGCTAGEGQVHVRPKTLAAPATQLATGENCPLWIGVDDGRLFWRTFFGTLRTQPSSGASAPSTLSVAMTSANVTYDATSTWFGAATQTGLFVHHADKSLTTVTPVASTRSANGVLVPGYLSAAGDGDVYYLRYDAGTRESTLVRLR